MPESYILQVWNGVCAPFGSIKFETAEMRNKLNSNGEVSIVGTSALDMRECTIPFSHLFVISLCFGSFRNLFPRFGPTQPT